MNVCEPVMDRWLIDDTFACRIGKGREAAIERTHRHRPIQIKRRPTKFPHHHQQRHRPVVLHHQFLLVIVGGCSLAIHDGAG
jgi:hypothetical protein